MLVLITATVAETGTVAACNCLNLRKECVSNVSSGSLFRSIILGHFTVVCSATLRLAMAAGDLAFIQLHCFYPVNNIALL